MCVIQAHYLSKLYGTVSMPVSWGFVVLLLGVVIGSPIYFNTTNTNTSDHAVPLYPVSLNTNSSNSTQNCKDHFCDYQNDTKSDPVMEVSRGLVVAIHVFNSMDVKPICFLPTCAVHHLGERFQTGDEKAGSATHDPYGIGKR